MAAYLLLRPYGDQGDDLAAARALASSWWVVAHVCGMLALASFALAALRISYEIDGLVAALVRWTTATGMVLVLPYYGAETFALNAVARRALETGESSLGLVPDIRDHPVAITMFGIGLLLLAVGGVALAVVWQAIPAESGGRSGAGSAAAWPLGLLVMLFLPHFFLPDAARMAYGVAYLAAAVLLAVAARRQARPGHGQAQLSEVRAPMPR